MTADRLCQILIRSFWIGMVFLALCLFLFTLLPYMGIKWFLYSEKIRPGKQENFPHVVANAVTDRIYNLG